VATGACGACHEPVEGTEHSFRPAGAPETLCTSCHPRQPQRRRLHGPYRDAQCTACHDPHGGATRGLLAGGSEAATCAKCHQRRTEAVVHGPYAAGACTACHAPHQSDHERLLHAPAKSLCLGCHIELGNYLAVAAVVHGPADQDCGLCHEPHASEHAALLHREPVRLCIACHDAVGERIAADPFVHGAVRSERSCASCHSAHGSRLASLLLELPSAMCIGCHDRALVNAETGKVVEGVAGLVRSARFAHGPIRNGDCHGCHFPHSSRHVDLLRESYPPEFYIEYDESHYALCFGCHEKAIAAEERTTTLTGFRDGDRNLHFLHVNKQKGRTCRACHEVHASNQPFHIRESVPFGTGDWLLPINFVKTENGGACAPGCHKTAGYDRVDPIVSGSVAPPAGRTGRRGG
jgi:predicted CXXCH cytochrome family protein